MAERYKLQLGQAIARRRRELGMSQKDLATATHHKEGQTVSRWERGENVPADLDAVVRALDWTIPDLVAGIEPPNRRVGRKLGLVTADPPPPDDQLDQLGRMERELSRLASEIEGLKLQVAGNVEEVLEQLDVIQQRLPSARRARRA